MASRTESSSSLAYGGAGGADGASSSSSATAATAATLASLEAVVDQQILELESSYPSIFTVVSTAAPGRAEKVSTTAPGGAVVVWRQLHGNLPYTIQGGTYITPIILAARWEAATPPAFTSSFTTFVNRKSLAGFGFSPQAMLYMDPLSGRILPSPSDSCWRASLAAYVRLVPQRLFEHIPPLVDCRSVSVGMCTPLILPYVVPNYCFPPLPLPATGSDGGCPTVLSGYDGAVCGQTSSKAQQAHCRPTITELALSLTLTLGGSYSFIQRPSHLL